MLELLLAATLMWPRECVIVGEMYELAARIRNTGRPLARVLQQATDNRIKRTLIHVYTRPDMSPMEWKWFAIGVCVGEVYQGDRV